MIYFRENSINVAVYFFDDRRGLLCHCGRHASWLLPLVHFQICCQWSYRICCDVAAKNSNLSTGIGGSMIHPGRSLPPPKPHRSIFFLDSMGFFVIHTSQNCCMSTTAVIKSINSDNLIKTLLFTYLKLQFDSRAQNDNHLCTEWCSNMSSALLLYELLIFLYLATTKDLINHVSPST